ncbi:MAG: hypothetical protein Q4B50_08575 [Bacillota bacterium]|nr:hypothetical protein [Bacillota bacterium]
MRKALKDEAETLKSNADYDGPETDFDRMISVESQLATQSLIRSDIRFFATTSRNKEGININDTDIHHVYVESHSMTDIRQMAGRIRSGVEHLYIILDSEGYNYSDGPFVSYIAEQLALKSDTPGKNMLSQLNTNLKEFCRQYHIPDLSTIRAYDEAYPKLGKYIDQVKKLSPYIEFNYISKEVAFNNYRKKSKEFYAREIQAFNDALGNPAQLEALFQEAFPEAKIHAYISPEDQARKLSWDFMYDHPDGNFTAEELVELLSRLDELLTPPKNRKRRKSEKPDPNRLLHKIGLHYGSRNHKIGTPGYSKYIITPWIKDKTSAA